LLHIAPTTGSRDLVLERFLRRYLVVVLSLAAVAFAGWWTATRDLLTALQVLISVLVVSCPCASGVALPLCSDLAASRLRRFGVFIREAALWGKLDRVRKIVFDKTGTLTLEGISLRNPEALRELTPRERSVLLAMVHDSFHPVSGCLREQLLAAGVAAAEGELVHEVVGFGLEIEHAGASYRLGRPEWAGSGGGAIEGDCVFTRDGDVLARFSLGEEARGDACEEISALRRRGCEVYILSGDRRAKVAAMADRLALPHAHCLGELSPQQKADWISQADDRDTLYLGDGANDSFAFDAACCTGTPAVDRGLLEQKADFYFLGRGLAGVRLLLDMAQMRRRTAHRVVAFAIAYNAVAVALCVAGRMNPLLAAVLMPASSLVSLGIVFAGLRSRGG
jgi:Cu2+-exporting ATPase